MFQSKKPFAPLTLDFMFKRAFATEKNRHILVSLINSFLGEKMECPLKEVFLISTVQPPKTGEHRGAIFDLHCQDAMGNRFIIEMQLRGQKHFIERLLFYKSQAIVNIADKGSEYDYSLPKIYTLSFLDFIPKDIGDVGYGNDESIQYISLSNERHKEIRYNYINIVAVLLPKFTRTENECKTTQDWWLYLFRNLHELEEIPQELLKLSEAPFKDLFETAKIAKFTKEELDEYEDNMKYWNDSKAILDYAVEEGMEKGIAIGEARGEALSMEKMLDLWEKGVPIAEAKKQIVPNNR
jgi:predicted transposase/invertase (TIGR01784 family)